MPDSKTIKARQEMLNAVAELLERIRFGSIALTIHDGKVVQVDATEKRRIAF